MKGRNDVIAYSSTADREKWQLILFNVTDGQTDRPRHNLCRSRRNRCRL